MRTEHLPMKIVFAGLLSIAVGGCGTSGDDDTGGTTGGAEATGGADSGGAGGSSQSPTGGTTTTSTGGSTGQPVTGGTGGQPETGGTTSTEPATGGTTSAGGTSTATGGAQDTGGQATGGRSARGGRGGGTAAGGTQPSGGAADTGGQAGAGGNTASGGGPAGGESNGGSSAGGRTGTGGGATGGNTGSGTCTASKAASATGTGRGPHKVVIETNSDAGIKCGTIYRPEDLGGDEKYPIFVWGEGACTQDGLSNQGAMGEIASYGYFVIADGTPGGTGACAGSQDGKQFLDYITWAIAENDKPCSAYYQSLDTTKVASDGFSCGGLMSEGISADPRLSAVGITSSGQMSANKAMYDKMHAPFKVMNGGSSDMAYDNGLRDYEEISSRGIPSVYFSKSSVGHGGDLGGKTGSGGDFTKVNLAWLNWQLKGDETATGKGFLVGASCTFCTDPGWDYKTNIE